MTRRKITTGLILILILFAIYFDQMFELENIETLRKDAHSRVEIAPPKEFTTDGCSLWLNSLFSIDISDVCIEHDIAYWKGGSTEDRKRADTVMRNEMNERILFMGDVMYLGVRIFGHHLVPAPWRWGYGFEYPYRIESGI